MINILKWIVRIAWLCAILLGSTLWFASGRVGNFAAALQVHMTLGGTVALVLAVLAVLALAARVRIPAAIVALVWAGLTVYVGTLQDWWVSGGKHPFIAMTHLVLGIGAIGLAEMLAAALTRTMRARKPASLA